MQIADSIYSWNCMTIKTASEKVLVDKLALKSFYSSFYSLHCKAHMSTIMDTSKLLTLALHTVHSFEFPRLPREGHFIKYLLLSGDVWLKTFQPCNKHTLQKPNMVIQKCAEMPLSLLHKFGREYIFDSNLCTVLQFKRRSSAFLITYIALHCAILKIIAYAL